MSQAAPTRSQMNKYYASVSQSSLQRLLDFRKRYPYQTLNLQGQRWRYIDTGILEASERIPLLALAGATTVAEVGFQSIAHFARQRRVIAPDYPAVKTIRELCDSLMALLDQLGVSQFDLIGGSYGGWMAQSLVRDQPKRVRRLVLTAIGPPDPENSRKMAKLLPWLRLVPTTVIKALLNRSFSRLDTSQNAEYPEMALLWALAREALETQVQRQDLFSLMERLVDQTEHYRFNPDDLSNWSGRILMIFGSQDPASPAEKREAMQALYPQAEMVVFEGGQHGIALTHQADYFAAIDGFLLRP